MAGQIIQIIYYIILRRKYVFNTTNFNYDLEKGFWTTTTWEIPKTAGTYQLAYSNDGGETWTKIGQPLTIVISAI